MTRMIVIWGTTYCALIKQALVGTEEGTRVLMMTNDNDSNTSFHHLNAMCHTLCWLSSHYNLLTLERQISFILCPFCSWGNWGLGGVISHTAHQRAHDLGCSDYILSTRLYIELDPLKFLSISFTPQLGSFIHVHIQFWEFAFQPQESFGVLNTLSEYRRGERKAIKSKEKIFLRILQEMAPLAFWGSPQEA